MHATTTPSVCSVSAAANAATTQAEPRRTVRDAASTTVLQSGWSDSDRADDVAALDVIVARLSASSNATEANELLNKINAAGLFDILEIVDAVERTGEPLVWFGFEGVYCIGSLYFATLGEPPIYDTLEEACEALEDVLDLAVTPAFSSM